MASINYERIQKKIYRGPAQWLEPLPYGNQLHSARIQIDVSVVGHQGDYGNCKRQKEACRKRVSGRFLHTPKVCLHDSACGACPRRRDSSPGLVKGTVAEGLERAIIAMLGDGLSSPDNANNLHDG